MSTTISAQEYRDLVGRSAPGRATQSLTPQRKPKSEASQIKQHLRAMGAWFLDEYQAGKPITQKSIDFYLRQLELYELR